MQTAVPEPPVKRHAAPTPWLQVRAGLPARTRALLGWGFVGALLLVWIGVTAGGFVPALLLPSPLGVLQGGIELAQKDLLSSVGITLWRITQALLLVIAIGIPVGVLMGSFAAVDAALDPIVSAVKSIPTTAFIALVIVWFGIEEKAKIVFLFLGGIFYMLILVRDAVAGVREELVRIAQDLNASPSRTIFSVLLPAAMPRIWDGITVCNGIMWTYVLLAEYINAKNGLGYLINIAQRLQRTDQAVAGVVVIGILSACTDWILRRVKARWLSY